MLKLVCQIDGIFTTGCTGSKQNDSFSVARDDTFVDLKSSDAVREKQGKSEGFDSWTDQVILPKSDPNRRFFGPYDLEIW